MTTRKIETTMSLCVIALTKYIMDLKKINYEDAYRFLLGLELYNLLNDEDSRMFLETNEYLCEACRIEIEEGIDAFYEYINK